MDSNLSAYLNLPLRIGCRTIPKRLVFAPMTFLGHIAFRELLADFGGFGLLHSEMCSAGALPRESRAASNHFRWRDEELPFLSCQIMGSEPARMAAAAERIETEGFFGVDLNFGCANASICRRHHGAAVLKHPDLAARIVECVRRSVRIPVTVKFRVGWEDDPQAAAGMARRFEAAGADALTFHPRIAPDRRARPAKWDYIGVIKQAVQIPVFGNGDVFDAGGCLRMIRQTGCDGVSLGRIAVARPWVFAEWTSGLRPTIEIHAQAAKRLLELTAMHFEEKAAVLRFRRFSSYFAANFRFGHALYRRIQTCSTPNAIQAALDAFFATSPELASSPNMNYLQ